jgi:hypothetical protein
MKNELEEVKAELEKQRVVNATLFENSVSKVVFDQVTYDNEKYRALVIERTSEAQRNANNLEVARAEIARLWQENDQRKAELAYAQPELKKLRTENARLREALKWYSTRYTHIDIQNDYGHYDNGEIARVALNE